MHDFRRLVFFFDGTPHVSSRARVMEWRGTIYHGMQNGATDVSMKKLVTHARMTLMLYTTVPYFEMTVLYQTLIDDNILDRLTLAQV